VNDAPPDSTSDAQPPPTATGISRRVVVQGAAWSIPVIAAAVAAPLAAASGDAALNFTLPAYAGAACTEITNVQASLTNSSGAPEPGKPITVTLSDGYTFADGSTTHTGTTDSSGKITLPAVRVPATGGNASFTAVTGPLTATAPVTAPKITVAFRRQLNGTTVSYANVPPGSEAIGDSAFLAPNGDLYFGNNVVATGVSAAGVPIRYSNDTAIVSFISSTGVASRWVQSTGQIQTFPSVPQGSTPIGDTGFLAPNGDLYFGNTLIATGALSAGVPVRKANDSSWMSYISSAGVASRWNSATQQTETYPNVPSGSVAIGDATFRAPNGDLWFGNNRYATGTLSAGAPIRNSVDGTYSSFISSTGVASRWNSITGQTQTFPNVPSDAVPIGDNAFLTPGGELWMGNSRVATNVSSAGVPSRLANDDAVTPYVIAPTCSW
jgi:hypothetical protein